MEFTRRDARSVLGYQAMVEDSIMEIFKSHGVNIDQVTLTRLMTRPIIMLFTALDGVTLDIKTVREHILAELQECAQETTERILNNPVEIKPGSLLPKDLSPRDFSPGGRFEGSTSFDHGEPPR